MSAVLISLAAGTTNHDWLSRNSTLIVGIVGIVFSGFVGPTVSAAWVTRRELRRDHEALIDTRRQDLRTVIDDAARLLGGAVSHLRPLLAAKQAGKPLPVESADFLRELVPLGQRLKLRLPANHAVVVGYEDARKGLLTLSSAASSQSAFDKAADNFERQRERFLDASREALQAPITSRVAI